ncbi:MAG: questin oxidase family protein, partial [Candidatus Thiodiazotropha sp.]
MMEPFVLTGHKYGFIYHISGKPHPACTMSIQTILEENNTDKYNIEYMQFLTNHVAHGIIALHRMGASEDRIRKFVDWYKDRMEPPVYDGTTSGDIESLKGKRVSFHRLVQHFQDLLKNKYKTLDNLVVSELPKYTLGLGSAALHGGIHLGYGFSARNERTVCEGLAYLHYSYRPLVYKKPLPSASELGKGRKTPTELLVSLAADKALHDSMVKETNRKPWTSLDQGPFQRRLSYLLAVHGDYFVDLLSDLNVDIPKAENGDIDLIELGREVVDVAITVYTLHEPPNDFFILHGV